MHELAITVIGPDRPGIVADVAEALAEVGANLTDSTMTRLRGHFAMTLVCAGPPTGAEIDEALEPLTADRTLLVTVRSVVEEPVHEPAGSHHVITLHGADRLGIVATLSRTVTEAGGNITDLSTRLAGPLYVLIAEVDVPAGGADELAQQLAVAGAELGVEVTLRRAETEIL